MKYINLTEEQKTFVTKSYGVHFDTSFLRNCLKFTLNPTDDLKDEIMCPIVLAFYMGQHIDRCDPQLTDKFDWIREVSFCIIADAKENEWYELSNNFECFIWFCESFVHQQRSIPKKREANVIPIAICPDFSDPVI